MKPGTDDQRLHRKRNGFTLLEVMIALGIFSIGILAVIGAQHLVVRGNANGNVVTEQMLLAQRTMERLKNNPDPTTLSSGTDANIDANGDPGGPYTVSRRVTNALSSTSSRVIEVTVTKQGPHGHPLTIRSVTHGNGV
ncbi:type IV pilus modification PilV family protein [Desulfofustis glycolicus]|uniref:N-terminal methylation site-containing protein n=1 Tax=Desulfofustis glycolicus DSM 9705 TaxID=1121409 RepID=A0A1M5X8F9_9BACT|nr:prepilin-type N-terminal cleavage/methylation domain-containing protein [Desulfofustis glycolicus]SHH95932.1 N-terminal methylation site-containing protein [Desulfofustis glycolicus DSM 9705]